METLCLILISMLHFSKDFQKKHRNIFWNSDFIWKANEIQSLKELKKIQKHFFYFLNKMGSLQTSARVLAKNNFNEILFSNTTGGLGKSSSFQR